MRNELSSCMNCKWYIDLSDNQYYCKWRGHNTDWLMRDVDKNEGCHLWISKNKIEQNGDSDNE